VKRHFQYHPVQPPAPSRGWTIEHLRFRRVRHNVCERLALGKLRADVLDVTNSISNQLADAAHHLQRRRGASLKGPNAATTSNSSYVVTGTSPDITSQTTDFRRSGNQHRLCLSARRGREPHIRDKPSIFGQGGADTVLVATTASALAISYNMFYQSGTEDIGGFGTHFSAPSTTVENITINAGAGDDNFALNSFGSGAAG